MTPRIAFDGAIFAAGPPTGVAGSFLSTLRAWATNDRGGVLLLPPSAAAPDLDMRVERTDAVTGWRRRTLNLPGVLRRLNADLLHSPVSAIPPRGPCPTVATVHDLPWFADTRLDESGCSWRHRRAAQVARRCATAIIVPSEATAADLHRDGAVHGRIEIIPHGVEFSASPESSSRHTGPFLVLGDDRPRKNREGVRRAHVLARGREESLPDLEFVGPPDNWLGEEAKQERLRDCRGLLMFSLHEGFGLPVLEAFAAGAPVACSDRKSLPEVAGAAALLVDPTDDEAMADAMLQLHRDGGLRDRLIREGHLRVAQFTPERTAERWRELHSRLLSPAQDPSPNAGATL